jgi:hypothetical protein
MHLLAYIDPGSGALIWQSIIGACVGALFYLKKTRQWVGRMMGKMLRLPVKHQNPAEIHPDKT